MLRTLVIAGSDSPAASPGAPAASSIDASTASCSVSALAPAGQPPTGASVFAARIASGSEHRSFTGITAACARPQADSNSTDTEREGRQRATGSRRVMVEIS